MGPTRDLGSDQFVYIHTYGFTPKSNLHINYCDDSPTAPHPVLCLTAGTALISNTDYVAQTLSDGTESLNNGTTNPPGNQIIVFSSSPGSPPIVPGEIIGAVSGLTWSSFIARPAMYTVPTLQPRVEPGFYSVALIGNVSAGTGRLIYVKHNQ